jgi:selenocysteine lyase/cysteine desulfurase
MAIEEVAARLRDQNRFGPVDPRAGDIIDIEPNLRSHLAAVFRAREDEVALTHSTSEGINIVSWSLNWRDGDEVIISNQEHPANIVPWYNLRDRFGIVIREADLSTGTDLVPEISELLSERTRMISVSHVSRNNGRMLRTTDCAELGRICREQDIVFHLDGAQGPGCVPIDFRALGCDCYSTCGHKWLLGPKGTGALFVRHESLDKTRLSWTGSHSHKTFDYEGNYTLKPTAARFEFGTRALADFAGFDRALAWMEELGLDRVHTRIQSLVQYAIEKTASMPRFDVSSPLAERDRSGVFVLRLPDGVNAWDIYNRLREEDYVHTSPVRDERDLRIALHFFNTEEEIDESFALIQRYCRT